MPSTHRYLRVQDLRRLRNLLFSSRRPVEGLYAGKHASPQRGRSVEFTDYRQYMPGDEISAIDWKVWGRTDKLFVKLFEHQTDMTVHLVVDASASMGYSGITAPRAQAIAFGTRPNPARGPRAESDSKYDHACRLAAAIAFLLTRQQDRVSFGVAQDGLAEFQRPQASAAHMLSILTAMERIKPAGEAHLAGALHALAGRVSRRSLIMVFSDLLDEAGPILSNLSIFTHRGGEVVLFHILHPDELKLPDLQEGLFVDSESDHRLTLNVADVRPAYEQRLRDFLASWSSASRGRGFDYLPVNSGTDYYRTLERYLFRRTAGAPPDERATTTQAPESRLVRTLEELSSKRKRETH
jgi:uncharacterized protein (DUF58 family)